MADAGLIALSAGIAVGITGMASAWAEKEIGSAAIGAMAENEKLFGKGLILTVIPETIVIFGMVVAILLWLNM
ncbi:MAG TPA: ATPase [Methanomassiliicoccales archaeon]|jgi:V/A-type H+/Na+-transporting ATPase subunit K|nr:V-type ATP synthase subunit K [Euryarchaeota archaeon]HOE52628.1 ATPase [Methanomassiliicoccales archaeon]NLX46931.1 V-type ATP synthase subunit K [Euryarchaeota archaeon]HPD08215.1 ATPase [Methanomassiliicoccales archaeon]HQM66711.1 ATPase [Methanomassiliicoccales archaeon]